MASTFGIRIRSAIQSAADAIDEVRRLVLGDPAGTDVQLFPFDGQQPGKAWQDDEGSLTLLTEALGVQHDNASPIWGLISTNATGVTPSIGTNFGIASATKDEGTGTLTVYFDVDFANDNYFAEGAVKGSTGVYHFKRTGDWTNRVSLKFLDGLGVQQSINSLSVYFFACGSYPS